MAEKKDTEQKGDGYEKCLVNSKMNKGVQNAEYAVRGEIVLQAGKMKQLLKNNKEEAKKYGFDKIIFCNIGNPQALGQIPLTFHRQVLAGVLCPSLISDESKIFPEDVKQRAKKLLSYTSGSIGAYTESRGMLEVRQTVAKFIENRDGFKVDPENIFLTAGASSGIKCVFSCMVSNEKDAILVPIPQYPLYSATITYKNGTLLKYELDEDNNWSFDIDAASKTVEEALKKAIVPRAIVCINPGNPTGQCFSLKTVNDIINFAYKYKMVILADEVYQENVYNDKLPFYSFKKSILSNKNKSIAKNLELISFHSCSKGIFGECGLRGGYFELTNIDAQASATFLKFVSINLCPNTIGQCMVELMCDPPNADDCPQSYKLFKKEYEDRYAELKKRAKLISEELNKVDGISCNDIYGAMYSFPKITISQKARESVAKKFPGKECDFVYCKELLEKYGICVVPGSGFKQKKDTLHFRTTLLPPTDQIKYVVESIKKFHKEFIAKYEE